MKRIMILLTALMFLLVMGNPCFAANYMTTGDQTFYGEKTWEHDQTFKKNVTIEGALLGVTEVSDEYYVCSTNGHDSPGNYGTTYLKPFATVDFAIGQCTANKGDIIHVLPGHAESYTAANGFDADVAGVTIIGYGNGVDMPEFTFADTDADIAIGAANVVLYNLRFLAGISAVVRGISVEAAGDDCAIISCEFPEPTTSTFEFVRVILVATGADRLLVKDNIYYNCDAVGTTNFIDLDAGIVNGMRIIGNYIYGEFAEGAIHTDKACLEMFIKDNIVVNMTTGQHGIEIAGNATGLLIGNLVSTDAIGTSYDIGHLNEHANYWDDYGTYDTMAVPWTTNETGVNRWGATELAQIEGEVEDGLEGYFTERTITAAETFAASANVMFTVAGGAIRITSLFGKCTTVAAGSPGTMTIEVDATAGAANDSDLSTTVNVDALGEGDTICFTDAISEGVLTLTANVGAGQPLSWFVDAGDIEQTLSSTGTGAVKWYMTYVPLEAGVTVTAP